MNDESFAITSAERHEFLGMCIFMSELKKSNIDL